MRYLLILIISTLPLIAQAAYITVQQAQSYAQRFLSLYQGKSSRAGNQLTLVWDGEDATSRSRSTSPAFYVFNRGTDNGFVIIAGSDASAPVLAYASTGTFSAQAMPPHIKAWMNALKSNVRHREQQRSHSQSRAQEWAPPTRAAQEIDLLTPNWNQDVPYNLKCPEIGGIHSYTGCAITATCIVMGYHKWPNKGVGSLPAYTVKAEQIRVPAMDLGTPYQWDKMPYINGNHLDLMDDEQREAISTLMYHTGVMLRAQYSLQGTSAHLRDAADGLIRHMKYNPQLSYINRDRYSDAEWSQLLRDEIDAKRPIIYEGFDENSGHAFVLDGYNSDGYFNVNWGWGGYNNGFYHLDDMAPGSQGIGASGSGTYNLTQGAIIRIIPRYDTEEAIDDLQYIYSQVYAKGIEVEGATFPVKKGDSFWLDAGIVRNMGTNAVSGTFKLAMTDHQGNIIEEFVSSPVFELQPGSTHLVTYSKRLVEVTQDVKPGYRIRMVFKSDTGTEWKPVTCDASIGKWEVILNDGEPQEDAPIDEATSMNYHAETGILTLQVPAGAKASLKNKQTQADQPAAIKQDGTTVTIEKSKLEKGTYLLTLEKGSEKKELTLKF